MSSHKTTSLAEEDYLSIIDLQRRFVGCKSWTDLDNCLLRHLLPLVACESVGIAWSVHELIGISDVFDYQKGRAVGIMTTEDLAMVAKLQSFHQSFYKKLITTTRPVIACDIDVSRKTMYKEANLYRRHYPEYQCPKNALLYNSASGKAMASYMAAIDRFESGWGVAVHRWYPNEKPFTRRDVRVMELVLAILFQTIKTIVLSEELAKHQSLAESLADVPIGTALIRKDMSVVFINKSFRKSSLLEPGHKLPPDMTAIIQQEIDRHSSKNLKLFPDVPFYKLSKQTFRLSINLVNRSDGDEYWLLRLMPTDDSFSQIHLSMHSERLSKKEREVCCLIKDGFGNKEIAKRLFISPHTVKTHIKHIYKKMEVQDRPMLVVRLHRPC